MDLKIPLLQVATCAMVLISGCAPKTPYLTKSYHLGDTVAVPMGGVLLQYAKGHQLPGGIGRDGFGIELVYTGKTLHELKLVYREYYESTGGSYMRPSYTLPLSYDITSDSTIVFRDYLLQVIEANAKLARVIVLREPQSEVIEAFDPGVAARDVPPGPMPKLKLKRSKVAMEVEILSEEGDSIHYQVARTNQRGRAKKSEIEFIRMPDGTVRRYE